MIQIPLPTALKEGDRVTIVNGADKRVAVVRRATTGGRYIMLQCRQFEVWRPFLAKTGLIRNPSENGNWRIVGRCPTGSSRN
jgi:hypothetical protein